jgi:hypothetical protein
VPYTRDCLALPFSGRSLRQRHNSYKAAIAQTATRGVKKLRMLDYITAQRRVTYHELMDGLGYCAGTTCSLLNALIAEKRVEDCDTVIGKYGHGVSVYQIRQDQRSEGAA